jgi:hypothetical protein
MPRKCSTATCAAAGEFHVERYAHYNGRKRSAIPGSVRMRMKDQDTREETRKLQVLLTRWKPAARKHRSINRSINQ